MTRPKNPTVQMDFEFASSRTSLQENFVRWLEGRKVEASVTGASSELKMAPSDGSFALPAPPPELPEPDAALEMCPICLEEVLAATIVRCRAPLPGPVHASCRGCFQRHVSETCVAQAIILGHDGDIPCIACTAAAPHACPAPPWSAQGDLEDIIDRKSRAAHWAAVQAAIRAPREKADAALALAVREAAAAEAGLQLAERVRQLRSIVVDADLTLKCPRCPARFDDYVGCNALRCGMCGCGFCTVCLADCGDDAHGHYVATHGPNYFDRPLFEHTQRAARTARVVARLRGLLPDVVLQRALAEALAWELGDLGIVAEDLLHEAGLCGGGSGASDVRSSAPEALPRAIPAPVPVAAAAVVDHAAMAELGRIDHRRLRRDWRCPRCTIVNSPEHLDCVLCGCEDPTADDEMPHLVPIARAFHGRRQGPPPQPRQPPARRLGVANHDDVLAGAEARRLPVQVAAAAAAHGPAAREPAALPAARDANYYWHLRPCFMCQKVSDRGVLANGICMDCMPGGRLR